MTFKEYLQPLDGQECELLDSDSTGYIVFFGHRTHTKNTHKLIALCEDFAVFSQKDFLSETAIPYSMLRIIKNL